MLLTGTPPTGEKWSSYYYAGGQRIAMRIQDPASPTDTNAVYYPLTDHLGSTSVTANENGAYHSELRYKPWGAIRWDSANYSGNATPTDFGFTGQRSHESDFGLLFYSARWYDSSLGRFTSADSIVPGAGNPGAWDRYAYVINSPVGNLDPTGHSSRCPGLFLCPLIYGALKMRGAATANRVVAKNIDIAVTVANGESEVSSTLVAAGIAVQSMTYLGIKDSRDSRNYSYANAGIGVAQISDAQMNGSILNDSGSYTGNLGLGGIDQMTDAGATLGMATRIGLGLEACAQCSGQAKVVVAALVQNGYGVTAQSIADNLTNVTDSLTYLSLWQSWPDRCEHKVGQAQFEARQTVERDRQAALEKA